MSHTITHLSRGDWNKVSQEFHSLVFGHDRETSAERVTGAFVDMDQDGRPFGFCTYIELDDETVYLQFGGVNQLRQKTPKTYRHYISFITELQSRYTYIKTKVEKTNRTYLMMCLKAGFEINGVEQIGNKLFISLIKIRGE